MLRMAFFYTVLLQEYEWGFQCKQVVKPSINPISTQFYVGEASPDSLPD